MRKPPLPLLLLLAGAVNAAEPAATPAPATPQESTRDAAAAPAAGTPPAPARRAKTDERFDPSEEISDDLSVSFPADI